ncbi:MAG: PilZ domain-containing protein [Desulfovibrionales bacterium]
MPSGQERREYERLKRAFTVVLRRFEFPLASQQRIELRCRNISAGGILIDCPVRFQQGELVEATITIPSLNKFHPGFFKVFENDAEQNLVAVAEVVRSVERVPGVSHELGIRFKDVYEDDWKALQAMIRKFTE